MYPWWFVVLIGLLRADRQREREMKKLSTERPQRPLLTMMLLIDPSDWLLRDSHSLSDTQGDGGLLKPVHFGGKYSYSL